MKYAFLTKFVILGVFAISLSSCSLKKKIVYYDGIDQSNSVASMVNYEPTLQPDDMLLIIVRPEFADAVSVKAVEPFIQVSATPGVMATGAALPNTYLIDSNGYIDFPLLGKIELSNLTKSSAQQKLATMIGKYVVNPKVEIRVQNFRITVQGEVNLPKVLTVPTERITLPEALTQAGDLTIFGKRDNILIIRESGGKRTATRVDITKTDFFNSPYYYLAHNDIIYVEPNGTRINSAAIGPNVSLIVSLLSLAATIIAITVR